MILFDPTEHPHKRFNPLQDEWILVSPHRAKRPWQGLQEKTPADNRPDYDDTCYLCPGNIRANGIANPDYEDSYVFDNDFAALKNEIIAQPEVASTSFFKFQPEYGICRVVCFSPKHNLTIPEMEVSQLTKVVQTWIHEYRTLGAIEEINYVQIFENKGSIMGCSNPHPHGQIWAQHTLPTKVAKVATQLNAYFQKHQRTLLEDYLTEETNAEERIVVRNDFFTALVPYWATWPFETMIISNRAISNITEMTKEEQLAFAEILQQLTIKYDNLFETSFPYSAGIHQAPTDGKEHPEWHFHMHFYPPLLRSASVKKFMVGYEMLAESQRDITPERSAQLLREQSTIHYKKQRI